MLTAPHAHQGLSVDTLMYRVNLSLLPAVILAFLQYGPQSVLLIFCCLLTALVCEALCLKLNPNAQGHTLDGAAILTALILALSLPPHAPLWLGALGSFIAIAFGKHIYGGLGQNLFNPAMLARVVLLIAFPVEMTRWVDPPPLRRRLYRLGWTASPAPPCWAASGERPSAPRPLGQPAGQPQRQPGESSFAAAGRRPVADVAAGVQLAHPGGDAARLPGARHPALAYLPAGIVPPLAQLTSGGLILGRSISSPIRLPAPAACAAG
ncbi:RnfABCDGE type electron transport complex subunit D [Sodalis ligni]|nr:RnfABCDGE type electron transport complex subunit D [Sodalis ligni]QWA13532.1 RnfABCDGE type electron transport complex subunit D [Sodalis ligni]